ncbi:Trihelix transcription factor ASIL2 [Linum perenne]
MSTPSPSSSSNPPQSSPAPISGKKPQPVPWTHQQTVHLIQAYQEKWYGLKRGQLKASHWEEVAAAVVSRCGHNGYQPLKSSTQCRHKMDKLRKRFREEKRRAVAEAGFVSSSSSSSTSWPYFRLMESLELGSPPIPIPEESKSEADSEAEEEEEEEESGYRSRSRSINYIIRQPSSTNGFGGSDYSGKKRKREMEENDRGRGGGGGMAAALVLAEEIRSFAGKMLGMEKKKIEMVKEMEKMRMEMENKRMVMILDAEKRIIESIQTAFGNQEEEEEEEEK